MKQAILIIGLCLFLTGCITQPLDIDVAVKGNPKSFHTAYETGNNTINVTIKQEASKLIIYKWPDHSNNHNYYFSLVCYDADMPWEFAFRRNLTLLSFTNSEYIEKRLDTNIVLRFPDLFGYTDFNLQKEKKYLLNGSAYADYECKIESDLKFQYKEYIDGILITNETNRCDYFWLDWNRIDLSCEISGCDYSFYNLYTKDRYNLEKFLDYPHEYITDNCFNDQTIYR